MMKRMMTLILMAFVLFLVGCSGKGQVMDGPGMVNSYHQISQEEAAKMMEQDDGHVVVDVRRQDEYDAGHIPGAILIPNESKRIVFYGSVQGVGFRWRARHAAEHFGCTGWCRNEWDGTVTMEIQGEEESIDT